MVPRIVIVSQSGARANYGTLADCIMPMDRLYTLSVKSDITRPDTVLPDGGYHV